MHVTGRRVVQVEGELVEIVSSQAMADLSRVDQFSKVYELTTGQRLQCEN